MEKICAKLLALLCLVVTPSMASIPCSPRKFSGDSVVCVCTESYCDTFDPLQRTDEGVVQVFESTRAGKRFEYREQRFNDGNNNDNSPSVTPWIVEIDHNSSEKMQEIIGFGGAFSDAAVLSIGSLSEKLQRDLLGSYYSASGLEYSVGRVVISGCDFSNRAYTYDDSLFDWDLANFSFVEEDTRYKVRN